jgi:hypothetical protein
MLSAAALVAAGPAMAQSASAGQAGRAGHSLSPSNGLTDRGDGIGWAMAGLVLAAVAYVLISIAIDDDDDEEPESP